MTVNTYVDESVTHENVLKAREPLRDVRVDDRVVILVSGHGAYDLSKEASYYYGIYKIDVKNIGWITCEFRGKRVAALARSHHDGNYC